MAIFKINLFDSSFFSFALVVKVLKFMLMVFQIKKMPELSLTLILPIKY